jgi:hypothetical protein
MNPKIDVSVIKEYCELHGITEFEVEYYNGTTLIVIGNATSFYLYYELELLCITALDASSMVFWADDDVIGKIWIEEGEIYWEHGQTARVYNELFSVKVSDL